MPAGAPRPEAAFRLPIGLFADELFEARMRANWYESAAMSEMNFWVARARSRARCGGVWLGPVPGGGRPARVR